MLHWVNVATKQAPVKKSRHFHTSEVRPVFKPLQLRPPTNKQRVLDLGQATVAASKSHNGKIEVPEGIKGGNQLQGKYYVFEYALVKFKPSSSSQAE